MSKLIRYFVLSLIVLSPLIPLAVLAEGSIAANQAQVNAREYLPGDFVHVIVDAPTDTAQITATMPDGTDVSLVQQRVSGLWRGIWQVPVNFTKGTYFAKLMAVDVLGNVFAGESDVFSVGELSMISLIGKGSPEVIVKAPLQEKITVEAVAKGNLPDEQELIKMIKKLVAQPVAGPVPALQPSEKDDLVKRNLELGKESLSQGNFSEAVTYFRIVLYLSPGHQIASSYLLEAQGKRDQAGAQKVWFTVLIAAGLVFSLLILWLLLQAFRAKAPPAKMMNDSSLPGRSLGAIDRNWCQTMGWSENPFQSEILKQLFAANNPLEFESFRNFIKARIEAVGGGGVWPFTESALEKIYTLAKGKPKEAIKICEEAVVRANNSGKTEITAELINEYGMAAKKKVLIVDDEEIIRASLTAILTKGGGYQTDFAIDGDEALKKIKHNTYNAILLDIEMPKLNGYEILKQIRAHYPNLPVIFVSGKGSPEKTLQSITEHNLTGYIEKPFTPEKVLAIVARTIKS